jgi:hypothetical protein
LTEEFTDVIRATFDKKSGGVVNGPKRGECAVARADEGGVGNGPDTLAETSRKEGIKTPITPVRSGCFIDIHTERLRIGARDGPRHQGW